MESQAIKALERAKAKKFKVDPRAVAQVYGAEIIEIKDNSETSGMVMRQGARIIIGVNGAHPENRQRFTVAHEIGHMLLHADQPLMMDNDGLPLLIGRRADGERSWRETEANAFAAALLMPEEWIDEAVGGDEIAVDDDPMIERLAKQFGVSQQAMVFRLINLGLARARG